MKKNHNIIFDLRDVIFNYHPEHRDTKKQFSVIKKGLEILLKCHAAIDEHGKKKNKLYVLSNASPESHNNFIAYHSDIFNYFDGIITSGLSGFSKPDARAFYNCIDRYNLNPEDCIFIDDKEINVRMARAVGMQAIQCLDHDAVMRELKDLNVF